jgi:hypothetical protein
VTDTNVIKLAQPGTFTDSLTEILRNGAHALLAQAVELEVGDFIGRYADLKTAAGRQDSWQRTADARIAEVTNTSGEFFNDFSRARLRVSSRAGPGAGGLS